MTISKNNEENRLSHRLNAELEDARFVGHSASSRLAVGGKRIAGEGLGGL